MIFVIRNKMSGFVVLATAILALTTACDKNIARPEDLAVLGSVSVSEITVGQDTLVAGGEGTTICWKVSDDDGLVQKIELATDDGDAHTIASEGCEGINPDHSTLYSVNVYVDDEIAKSGSIYVKVLDETGTEVTETPDPSESAPTSETACSDAADDEGDGATDCDDSDCAQDAACAEPVYAFTSVTNSAADATPLVGDAVKISWDSNFQSVLVYRDNARDAKLYGPSGSDASYEFTAEDAATTIVLVGMVNGGEYASSDAITIDADTVAPSTFDTEVSATLSVSPSTQLVYGQTYTVSWSVSGGGTALLDGAPQTSPVTFTATDSTKHTLTISDNDGDTKEYSKSITVKSFAATGDSLSSSIDKITVGAAKNQYYFSGTATVYGTEDALGSISVVYSSDLSYDITAVAESNGTLFVGTGEGLYACDIESAACTPAISTHDNDITALYAQTDGTILVGTINEIFAVAACETSSTGYCSSEKSSPTLSDGTEVIDFVVNASDHSQVVLLTDSAAYESADGGATFAGISGVTNAIGGYWNGSSAYLWASNAIFARSNDTFTQNRDLATSDINAVAGIGSYVFVGTSSGVKAYGPDGYFNTNLNEDTAFFIVKSATSSGGTLNAVTASGDVQMISLSGRASLGAVKITAISDLAGTFNSGGILGR